jgi:aerobic-type carbon monoxide dehydrogenase small subunit (CoxS/CutS family)
MIRRTITFTINGKPATFGVDVRQSLLHLLRDKGYTSVKEGCGVGECGACTVLVDETPIDACLYLAVWADGRAIRTAEGESRDGKLSRVQKAYLDTGAVQCGFCTPGLIMTSTAFVETHSGQGDVSRETIRREHAGNLCRCTGYEGIIQAVEHCLEEKAETEESAGECACDLSSQNSGRGKNRRLI